MVNMQAACGAFLCNKAKAPKIHYHIYASKSGHGDEATGAAAVSGHSLSKSLRLCDTYTSSDCR